MDRRSNSFCCSTVPEGVQVKVLIGLIYLITVILTEVSSNAATAIIMTPIALAVTNQMGLDPRAFVFAVALPLGFVHNSCWISN